MKSQGVKSGKCRGQRLLLITRPCKLSRTVFKRECHFVYRGSGDTQRQARELISGPYMVAKVRFLSFNRAQSRAVTDFLIGHNTLRRHLHVLRLPDSPLCRRCGAEEETSAPVLCECEALASLRHEYLGSFFSEPEDIKSIILEAIWNYSKVTGLP